MPKKTDSSIVNKKILNKALKVSEKRLEDKLDAKFTASEKRLEDKLDAKFTASEKRLEDKLDEKFDTSEKKLEKRLKKFVKDVISVEIAKQDLRIDERFAQAEEKASQRHNQLMNLFDGVTGEVKASHEERQISGKQILRNSKRIEKLEAKVFGSIQAS